MEAKQEIHDSVNLADSPKHKLNAYTNVVTQELKSIPEEQLTPDERLQLKVLLFESNDLAKQEGREETDPEFTEVLDDLHSKFDPIRQRHLAISEREQVLRRFETLLGEIRTSLNRKFHECSDMERQYSQEFLLLKTFEEWYSSWLSKKLRMSDSAFKRKLYSLRTLQIQSQLENLECMVRPILNRLVDTKGPPQTQITAEDVNVRKKTSTDPRSELEDLVQLVQKQLEIIPAHMVEPDEKEQIQQILRSANELLEISKGQPTSPSVFLARIKKVKTAFAPLQRRYSESVKRMLVVEEFQDLLKEMDEYSDPSSEDSLSSGDQNPRSNGHTKSLKSWYSRWLERKLSVPDSVVETKLYELRTLELQSKLEELQCQLRPYSLFSVDSHRRRSAQLRQRREGDRSTESLATIYRQSAPVSARLQQSSRGSLRRGTSLIDSPSLSLRSASRRLQSNSFDILEKDELDTKPDARKQGQSSLNESVDADNSAVETTKKKSGQEIKAPQSKPELKPSTTTHEVADLTSEHPISSSTPQTLLSSLNHKVSPEEQEEQNERSGTEVDHTQVPVGKKNNWMDQRTEGEGSSSQLVGETGRSESLDGKTSDAEQKETYEPHPTEAVEMATSNQKPQTNTRPSILSVNGTAQIKHRPAPQTPPPSPVPTGRDENWGQEQDDKVRDHDLPIAHNVESTEFDDKNGSLQGEKSGSEATSGREITEHKTEQLQQHVSSSTGEKTGEDEEISMLRIIQGLGEHVHVNQFLCEAERHSQKGDANANTGENKNELRGDTEVAQDKKISPTSEEFPVATPTPPPSPTMLNEKTTVSDAQKTQKFRSTRFFSFSSPERERPLANDLTLEAMNLSFSRPIPAENSPPRSTAGKPKRLQRFKRNATMGGEEIRKMEKITKQKDQTGTEFTSKTEETVSSSAISMMSASPTLLPTKILRARDGSRQGRTKRLDRDMNYEEQPELSAIERTASVIVKTVIDNAVLEIMKGVKEETNQSSELKRRKRVKFGSQGEIEESFRTEQVRDGDDNLGEEMEEMVHVTKSGELNAVPLPATQNTTAPILDAFAPAEAEEKRSPKETSDRAFESSVASPRRKSMPSTVEGQKQTVETIVRTEDASKVRKGTDGETMASISSDRNILSATSSERSSVEAAKKDGSETTPTSANSHDQKAPEEYAMEVHGQAQTFHSKKAGEKPMKKVETPVTPPEKAVTIPEVTILCEDFKKLVKEFKNQSESVVCPGTSIHRYLLQINLEWYGYWIVHFRMLLQKSLSPSELVQIKNTIERKSKAMKSTCNYLLECLRKRTTSVKNADIKCEPSENLFHREKTRRGLEVSVSRWLANITNNTTVFEDPKDLYEMVVILEKTEDWLQNEGRHLSRENYMQWLDQLELLKSASAASSAQLQDAVDRYRTEIQAMKLKSTKLMESEVPTKDVELFESRVQFYEDWLNSHCKGQGSPDFPGSLSSKLTDNLLKKREILVKLDKLEQQERPHTAQLEKEIRILHVKQDVYDTWLNIPRIPTSFEWAVDNPKRMIKMIDEQRITMEKELYAMTEKFTEKESQ